MGKHSFLSASASHRWINCPPSARLCEEYADRPSEYAQEGTNTPRREPTAMSCAPIRWKKPSAAG